MVANIRIMGLAPGSIMPAIITHHMTSMSRNRLADQPVREAPMALPMPAARSAR